MMSRERSVRQLRAVTRRLVMGTAVLGAAAAALAPTVATAQEAEITLLKPQARQGYYVGGGPRLLNWIIDDDDIGSLGGMFGFGGSFRFGQKVNDWLGLGLSLSFGAAGNADWGAGGGGLQLEAQVQPWLDLDLAFRAGIGLGGFGVSRVNEDAATDDDPEGTVGTLYTLAVSYELFPWYEEKDFDSGGYAFSFFAEGQFVPGLGGLSSYGVVFGVEFTWWSGLDKNKLELPVDAAFKKDD